MKNPFKFHVRIVEGYYASGRSYHIVQSWSPWWPFCWTTETKFNNAYAYESALAYAGFRMEKKPRQKVLWKDGVTL